MSKPSETIGNRAIELYLFKRAKWNARLKLRAAYAEWKEARGIHYQMAKDSAEYTEMMRDTLPNLQLLLAVDTHMANAKKRLENAIMSRGIFTGKFRRDDSFSRSMMRVGLCPECGNKLHSGKWTEEAIRAIESDPDVDQDNEFEDMCDDCFLKYIACGDEAQFEKMTGRVFVSAKDMP